MFVLEGIFSFFVFVLTSTVGGQYINSRCLLSTNKPSDNDQIFNVRTSTVSQCIYVCVLNTECRAIVYDNAGSMCLGYRTQTEEEPLNGEEEGWKIVYAGIIAWQFKLVLYVRIFGDVSKQFIFDVIHVIFLVIIHTFAYLFTIQQIPQLQTGKWLSVIQGKYSRFIHRKTLLIQLLFFALTQKSWLR